MSTAVWKDILRSGVDFDSWGQVEEAIKEYKRFSREIKNYAIKNSSQTEKAFIAKICLCVMRRIETVQSPEGIKKSGIQLNDMKKLLSVIGRIGGKEKELVLPIDAGLFENETSLAELLAELNSELPGSTVSLKGMSVTNTAASSEPSLLPPPLYAPGCNFATIEVKQLGIKDAEQYVDAFVAMSVYDEFGNLLEDRQQGPPSNKKEPFHVILGTTFHVQTPLHKLRGGAIVFEFNHYKRKKEKISTRCWAFLEFDEIKKGPAALEMYKKPADPLRKRIKLFSVKSLFLQLNIDIRSD